MEKECISVSFVAVFTKILPNVPALENRFCRELFGMPYDTFNGFTPDGYVIAVENKSMPSITITPQKIVFKAKTIEKLAEYIYSISQEFKSKSIPMSYSAFGINSEYQWIDLPETAGRWMWQRFVNPSLGDELTNQCNNISLRFGINETEHLNMDFLPRVGRHDGIFASINHHHVGGKDELPNKEVLYGLFNETNIIVDKKFSSIIGEVL